MRGTVFSDVPVSVEGADLVVSALERDLLADPVTVDGISISRSDLADMVGSLTDRRADGRSVFLLQGAETPEGEAEMERVRDVHGARYALTGPCGVGGSFDPASP